MSKLLQRLQPNKISVLLAGMIFSSVTALMLGFAVPRATITAWFHASGYYFICGTFLFWLCSLLPEQPDARRAWAFVRRHGLAAGLAMLLIIGAELTSPPQFRILADETNLAAVAFAMYDTQTFHNPIEGLYYFYNFETLNAVWDSRPLFFPFLVAVAHTLGGYRWYNSFVVNALAGGSTLFCFYLLLQRWFSRSFGLLGMILLAAFPLFLLCVTSGGYETVNLLFAILAFLLFDLALTTQASRYLEMLGLTLILLAQLRYESALFLFCLAPALLPFRRRFQYGGATYRALLFPLLLLPIIWQRRIAQIKLMEQTTPADIGFSVQAFFANLKPAWDFFTGQQRHYGMIPLLFYGALLGLGYGLFCLGRDWRTLSGRVRAFTGAAGLALIVEVLLILSLQNGALTLPYTLRLGLIFLPWLVSLAVLLLYAIAGSKPAWRRYLLVGSVAILLFYWPAAGKNDAIRQIIVHREYRLALDFLQRHYPDPNIVVVSDRPGMYTPHRWGAVSFGYANQHAADLRTSLQRHLFQAIIVLQRINYADQQPEPATALDASFRLETLFEAQLTAETHVRFSRVRSD